MHSRTHHQARNVADSYGITEYVAINSGVPRE